MHVFQDQTTYMDRLVMRGFEVIGKGLYSRVLAKPGSDRVIKIGRGDDWPRFIMLAMTKRHTGSHAPLVYSLKFHHHFYVAVMERLLCTMQDVEFNSSQYHHYIAVSVISGYHCNTEHQPLPPKLAKFAQLLRDHRLNTDLHKGNVMLRKDGTLVVIDPSSRKLWEKPLYRIKHQRIVNH